ncbi:hypothetical protein [Natranaerofaba carboxydovora]|uniref:hypothetical protein n=1 Tax=Natranaerofaba carboxydovora TaxID=2742683 RepID=UPI001F12F292|nr:hypothetical protein [Natranaerofaba carboxydovora]UMZ75088.1 hypothetical protein ACONDI_02700 [Natranaerofaba carboxydovora]
MKRVITVLGLTVILVIFAWQVVLGGTYGEPGSEDDPLLTKSYIDEVLIPELEENFEEMIGEYIDREELDKEEAEEPDIDGEEGEEVEEGKSFDVFEIVELEEDERLIAGESAEIISRTGEGVIMDSDSGGISDLTKGVDLREGDDVPLNHHLLVPRADGRGVEADTYMILMVRGEYEKERD